MFTFRMDRKSVRTTTASIGAIVVAVCLLAACDTIQIKEQPQGWEPFSGISEGTDQTRPYAYFKSIRLTINGGERNLNPEFLRRVRDNIRDTNLFRDIVFEKPAPQYPHVELSLSITVIDDRNDALNFLKMMGTAASLGVLGPLLPMYGDYSSELHMKVMRSDGKFKVYRARSSGTAKAMLDLNRQMGELMSKIYTYTMNSIMSQMVGDADYYRLNFPREGYTS